MGSIIPTCQAWPACSFLVRSRGGRAVILVNPAVMRAQVKPVTVRAPIPTLVSSGIAARPPHACMGHASALYSHRLRIAREHAGGTGELARGQGSGDMIPAGRRAVAIVVWPMLPSRGCKDHKVQGGGWRGGCPASEPVPVCACLRRLMRRHRIESDVAAAPGCHGRRAHPASQCLLDDAGQEERWPSMSVST